MHCLHKKFETNWWTILPLFSIIWYNILRVVIQVIISMPVLMRWRQMWTIRKLWGSSILLKLCLPTSPPCLTHILCDDINCEACVMYKQWKNKSFFWCHCFFWVIGAACLRSLVSTRLSLLGLLFKGPQDICPATLFPKTDQSHRIRKHFRQK